MTRKIGHMRSLDHLHQFHHQSRVEEVHVDDLVGALRGIGDPGTDDGRAVGRQNGMLRSHTVQVGEDFAFDVEHLDGGFDHVIGRRCGFFETGGEADAFTGRLGLLFGQASFSNPSR